MKANRSATRLQYSLAGALAILALLLALSDVAKAGNNSRGDKDSSNPPSATATANSAAQDDALRMQGEKAFHANCARCHAAPPKFPPRMVATIVRHMRVRATITGEEARLILHYMAE